MIFMSYSIIYPFTIDPSVESLILVIFIRFPIRQPLCKIKIERNPDYRQRELPKSKALDVKQSLKMSSLVALSLLSSSSYALNTLWNRN